MAVLNTDPVMTLEQEAAFEQEKNPWEAQDARFDLAAKKLRPG